MNISSVWTGLANPVLDPSQVAGGEEGIAAHPSTRMRALGDAEGRGEEGWASVRVEGKDWGKVLSVGRLGGRVVACKCFKICLPRLLSCDRTRETRETSMHTCIPALTHTGFCHEHALILYVYLSNEQHGADESVLTVSAAPGPTTGYRTNSGTVLRQQL